MDWYMADYIRAANAVNSGMSIKIVPLLNDDYLVCLSNGCELADFYSYLDAARFVARCYSVALKLR